MSIKVDNKDRRAWTLVEMMIALGIFSICGVAMMSLYMFSARSLASIYNYASLDQYNRQAMDLLTREIREARQVIDYTTNSDMTSITILTGETNAQHTITYSFTQASKQFVRNDLTDGSRKVLLNSCNMLAFGLFMRSPGFQTYDVTNTAVPPWSNTVKVVQLSWKTTKSLPNGIGESENIQTARIVIRKQQDN
jgi:prepilin-type N-terminal cleavage/methylation domain-containing protein